jgi:hypothetical protein
MSPTDRKPKEGLLIIAGPKPGGGGPPPLSSPERGSAPQAEDGENESDQHCGNCRFFDGSSMCLRFPPHGYDWSQVSEDAWCGEWQGGPNHKPHGAGEMEEPGGDEDAGMPPASAPQPPRMR